MENKEELELIRFRLKDDEGNVIGCLPAVSIVTDPAIELSYQLFNKPVINKQKFIVTDQEKMEITGPAMIPGKPMLRYDELEDKYFNGVFEASDVKDAAELFLRTANHNQANFEHEREFTNKIALLETWIVEDPANDKASALGFDMEDIPAGAWFITYKVLDKELWEHIKSSEFTGFSVEVGAYEQKISQYSAQYSAQEIAEMESDLDELPIAEEKIETNLSSKYELIYNLIKDIAFSDRMDMETKNRFVNKLLSKI